MYGGSNIGTDIYSNMEGQRDMVTLLINQIDLREEKLDKLSKPDQFPWVGNGSSLYLQIVVIKGNFLNLYNFTTCPNSM